MAAKKRNTRPADLFDAQIEIEGLMTLFENIKVQNRLAEDGVGHAPGAEPFLAAIDALAEKGVRRCEDVDRRITKKRRVESKDG